MIIEIREGKSLNYNKKVKVYRNLHNNKLSIVQNNLVVAYADEIYLKDVTFTVRDSGLKKVREEKRKNVHAFVNGYIVRECKVYGYPIEYDPYLYDTFVFENGDVVEEVSLIYINNNGKMIGG